MPVRYANQETYDIDALENRAPSVGHLLRSRVQATPSADAYRYPIAGQDAPEVVTWRQAWEEISAWAAGFVSLGVEVGDRVSICSTTRIEWIWANWGIMAAGAATTTVYPTSNAETVSFIVGHSGSRVVVAEDAGQVGKLVARRHELPDVAMVVVIDAEGLANIGSDIEDWVVTAQELCRRGRVLLTESPSVVDDRIDELTPEHLSTIIYTSGTTGHPKGAELTHDTLVYEGASVEAIDILSSSDEQYLWLPLSHVFGNVLLVIAVSTGSPTYVDGRLDQIVPNLPTIRPTWMGAAPRIFEKAYAAVNATLKAETGPKAKLIEWAFGIGHQVAAAAERDEPLGPVLRAQHAVADKLVLSKVRDRFGGRIRFFISGSARLEPELSRWFAAVGMLIIEGYGLTETCAATCVNRPVRGGHQHGSIGWPLPGTSARIDDDGELLIKGPGVMRGYHGDEEATAKAFTDDGYFRTGDVGEIDEHGFVRITDRKNDVFKTSGGKHIAPQVIEAKFKGMCPYVGQFVVLGRGRHHAVALVTLDPDAIAKWAQENGMGGREYADIVTSDEAEAMVQGYIDQLNSEVNQWETIKKFVILDRDLTIEDGELTPSLKLRRRVVADKFSDHIDELYAG